MVLEAGGIAAAQRDEVSVPLSLWNYIPSGESFYKSFYKKNPKNKTDKPDR